MVLLVNALQPIERQVRIDLCSRNVRMSENRLNRAQVGAIFDHVRGATVAQHVRTGISSHAR